MRAGESAVAVRGAVIQGSVDVEGAFRIESGATVQGPIFVAQNASLEVAGALQGPLTVADGGRVVVEQFGKLLGPLASDGGVEIFGTFAGPVKGVNPIVHPGGRVVEAEVRDGKTYYNI
ncbi:MAG: hypothetical protein K0S70_1005 [Microbacterium sp.]|nr:hypothetical protein [Microbacterium sp.]